MAVCAASGRPFTFSDDELSFYARHGVPEPSLCPQERLRRRLTFRHGGKLHHVNCALTGKRIVSMYPANSPFPIYEQRAWWSDAWSGLAYGQEVDFRRPFLPQVQELFGRTPHIALVNTNSENSYYTNHGLNLKNCYLLFGATDDEDCLYGYFIISCTDVLDSMSVVGCELCYDGVASFDCYNCISFTNCKNCNDCLLIEDCNSCEGCIGCVGLRGQKYCLWNKPIGKEAYTRLRAQLETSRYSQLPELESQFLALKQSSPRLFAHLHQCEDCSGDALSNCKECIDCYDLRQSEACRYISFSPNSTHSQDCSFTAPAGVQFCYECVSTLGTECKYNAIVWHSAEVDYSIECHHSRNLFGCVSLKNAQYCILNRQYSREDYFALRTKVIELMQNSGEWGEFFPILYSPHAYNDSMAAHYFPLTKDEATSFGYRWRDDPEDTAPPGGATRAAAEDAEDDRVVDRTFRCDASGKHYKVTAAELAFYRKMRLPLPRFTPEERHRRRFARRHRYQLFSRSCGVCQTALDSIYSEADAPVVLCERDFLDGRP